MKSNDVPVSFI